MLIKYEGVVNFFNEYNYSKQSLMCIFFDVTLFLNRIPIPRIHRDREQDGRTDRPIS